MFIVLQASAEIGIKAVTRASLALAALLIPGVKQHLMKLATSANEKQSSFRNFDNANKDFQEHLAELDKKIVQVVDAALNQQLANWERRPPVPSDSFKAIGKQLTKFHEAVHDILAPEKVAALFLTIHNTFLQRVRARLAEVGLRPDNSPSHGLVMSELIFYRENLKYIHVLPEETLRDSALNVIWEVKLRRNTNNSNSLEEVVFFTIEDLLGKHENKHKLCNQHCNI